ncbi:hypothetical protein GCM10027348_31300 [Hymenobacter tenuis]
MSCDYYDSRLVLVNKTKTAICVEMAHDTIPDYPSLNRSEVCLSRSITPGTEAEQTIPGSMDEWVREVNRSKNKQLNLFIYATDSVRRYHSMDSLNQTHRYTTISLSLKELEAIDWRVIVE